MSVFDSSKYGDALKKLVEVAPLNDLGPGRPMQEHEQALRALEKSGWPTFGNQAVSDAGSSCMAALWLRFDFQDRAHEISQAIESPLGSYLHGIVHRREPDFSNARYWFRRVGSLPFFNDLQEVARMELEPIQHLNEVRAVIENGTWQPLRFVDLCEWAYRAGGEATLACRHVQQREWELLFDHCYRQATATTH